MIKPIIKVLGKDKKGETHRGYYWVYHNGVNKTVLFDYRERRSREDPSEILKNFQGTCKLHGIEPHTWLKIGLKIPSHPINRIKELLPSCNR